MLFEKQIIEHMINAKEKDKLLLMYPTKLEAQELLIRYMEKQDIQTQKDFYFTHHTNEWRELLFASYENQVSDININIDLLNDEERKETVEKLDFLIQSLYIIISDLDFNQYGPIQQKWCLESKLKGSGTSIFDSMEQLKQSLLKKDLSENNVKEKQDGEIIASITNFFKEKPEAWNAEDDLRFENLVAVVLQSNSFPNVLILRQYVSTFTPNNLEYFENALLETKNAELIGKYTMEYPENPYLMVYVFEHCSEYIKEELEKIIMQKNEQSLQAFNQENVRILMAYMINWDVPILGTLHLGRFSKLGADEFLARIGLPDEIEKALFSVYQEGEYSLEEKKMDAKIYPYLLIEKQHIYSEISKTYEQNVENGFSIFDEKTKTKLK